LDHDGRSMIPGGDDEAWDADTMELSLAGHEIYSTVLVDNEELRVFSAPLWGLGGIEGVVQVAHPLAEQKRLNEGLVRTLLMLVPLTLLVAALGGAFLTDRALRPVRQI